MLVEVKGWTGDGGTDRAITLAMADTPDLVLVKRITTNNRDIHYRASAGFAANTDSELNATTDGGTDGIRNFAAGEFRVGNNSETNENTSGGYVGIAIADDGNGDFKVGTYTGDNTDNRGVTGAGFSPEFVLVFARGSTDNRWHGVVHGASTDTSQLLGDGVNAADHIQTLDADGFTVGVAKNATGVVYVWAAFKRVVGAIEDGSYTGNAADARTIDISDTGGASAADFTPEFVATGRDGRLNYWRTEAGGAGHSGDSANAWSVAASVADHIQAFNANGFEIGTNADINGSGATVYYFAFKSNAAVAGGGFRSRIAGGFVLN